MGHKVVCFSCRKSFSEGPRQLHHPEICPECGGKFIRYTHRFRTPKKTDLNAWKVVHFLYEHGFVYQHIYENTIPENSDRYQYNLVKYPDNLIDARDFVTQYKEQAKKSVNQ